MILSKDETINTALQMRGAVTEILSFVYDSAFKAGRCFNKNRHCTPVRCLNMNKELLMEFKSIKEASKAMGYKSPHVIPDAIKFNRMTRKGYYWELI